MSNNLNCQFAVPQTMYTKAAKMTFENTKVCRISH